MKASKYILAAVALSVAASPSLAVDVTVNSTLPEVIGSNYQTITAALNYVTGQAAPRMVRVTGGGPYSAGENLGISVSLTLKGDGYRPVIAAPATAGLPHSTLNGNGISIYTPIAAAGTPLAVRLENFVLIPALTGGPIAAASKAIRSNNNVATFLSADNMSIEVVDVLVAPNNGSNQPSNNDGLTSVSVVGPAVTFGDDGIFISGMADLACTGTIVTNVRGVSTSNDGIVFNPDVAGFTCFLGPGTVSSYNSRMGIQIARNGSKVRMYGSAASPVLLTGNWIDDTKNAALSLFGSDGGSAANDILMQYVAFKANNASAMVGGLASAPVPPLFGDKLAFDSNQEAAITIGQNRGPNGWTISNSTFVNNALRTTGSVFPQIVSLAEATAGGSTGPVGFYGCILAGNGTAGNPGSGANLIQVGATASTVTFQDSAIVTAGPYAVGTGKYRIVAPAVAPTETNVINADPQLQAVGGNHAAANYLDVVSTAYDNAGLLGGDLSGYGDFVGVASVNNWSLY